ncbi:MAG: ABC transporter ATP-binding protein [Candidatus Eremiobacteraeota bacterium]|nr:ABC transporter ATP-binding protein [Candidatus Eremiobacteraeota bacterium]
MSILTVTDIHKTYITGKTKTPALRGTSVTVEKGEFTAIVGPSGSGKTTLINMIGGLDVPDNGSIVFDNIEITGLPQKKLSDIRLTKIGFIFQAYNLIPVLSALENVEYVMLLQGVPEKERREKSIKLLEEIGLKDLIHKRPNEMSGGQQQRVAVARAIISEPMLILADEPTANLDSKTSGSLLDMMRKMNEEKHITFLFSTHDSLVMERARRIVSLIDGVVVGDSKDE